MISPLNKEQQMLYDNIIKEINKFYLEDPEYIIEIIDKLIFTLLEKQKPQYKHWNIFYDKQTDKYSLYLEKKPNFCDLTIDMATFDFINKKLKEW